jgi:hypothetical protein
LIRLLLLLPLSSLLLAGQGMGGAKKGPSRIPPKWKGGPAPPAIDYRDVAGTMGLTAPNVYGGEATKRYILEMSGNGVAILDFDNDGWSDVLLVNGTRFDGSAKGGGNVLYKNRGDGSFTDVTAGSGIGRSGWGQGVCAGDYDNDGNTDLLITYYGYNVLYRNRSGMKFEDVTGRAGLPITGQRWATSCVFLDYDRDGYLDLFVSNYLGFDLKTASQPGASPFCFWKGLAVFCGPRGFPGGQNILYRNNRAGGFEDVSKKAGILTGGLHYGLGVIASDFDNDGWPDIYVACDSTPGILYANNRNGTFADIAVEAGAAYGDAGQEMGSMGVAAGDYDGDGLMDIVKTNFMDEASTLYHNEGERFFTDVTYQSGLGINTKFVGWGVEFVDVDQDGWKDILMANGHIYPEMERGRGEERFLQSKLLYWNDGKSMFRDVTVSAGGALNAKASSRGMASGDLDGDGALESVVINMNAAPSMLRNVAAKGYALLVQLEGVKSNRSAIGAKVRVEAGGRSQVQEVRSGSSYASQPDFRLHFGLGTADAVDRIEIQWPSGKVEATTKVPANHRFIIREGEGVVRKEAFRPPSRLP